MRKYVKVVLLASASGLFTAPAFGQPAAAPSQGLDEIVVTAQRREESAQNVPVSVSVVAESDTKAFGITDTSSLSAAVPGLEFTRSLNNATPSLRGIGTNPDLQTGDESAVAVYVDGVYLAAPSASIFSFDNISRIEVLKGPQGTLFGRNATGGVIQVITKDPEQTPSGNVEIGYGNYDTATASGYATTGLGEAVAADIAVRYSDQMDGWGSNLFTGQDAFKEKEYDVRSKWLITPGSSTKITISGDYNYAGSDVGAAAHAYPGTFFLDGTAYSGFYNINESSPGYATTRQYGVSAKVDQDLTWAKLVSITSYRDTWSQVLENQPQTRAPIEDVTVPSVERTETQELQLLSPSESKIKWIVGAFYMHDVAGYHPPIEITGLALQQFPIPGLQDITISNTQRTSSYAGFGQTTAEVLPATNLTLGLRYTVDERRENGIESSNVVPLGPPSDMSANFSKLTWKAALDHRFNENILGYFSYSTGFKSGLFNLISPGSAPVKPEVIDAIEVGFKTDLLDNKVRFNVAAYYYRFKDLQVSILQENTATLINAASSKSRGFDADVQVAATKNFRITSAVSYIDSIFTSFPDAPIDRPNPGPPFGDSVMTGSVAGNTTPRSPRWTANLDGKYTINRSEGEYTLSAGYYYNSGFFWDPGNHLRNPAYRLVNSSVRWQAAGNGLNVQVWGKNLLNDQYYAWSAASKTGDEGTPAPPRTYGITLGYRF